MGLQPRDVPQRHRHASLPGLPFLFCGSRLQQFPGRGQAGLQQSPRPDHLTPEAVILGQAALEPAGGVPLPSGLGRSQPGRQPRFPAGEGMGPKRLRDSNRQLGRQLRDALPVGQQPAGGPLHLRAVGFQSVPVIHAPQIQFVQVALPVGGVGQAGDLFLVGARLGQPLGSVLAQQVVHLPGIAGPFLHQAGVEQPFQRLPGVRLIVIPHGHHGRQLKAVAGKDAQPAQSGLVGRVQVTVTGIKGDDHAQVGPVGVLPLVQNLQAPGLQVGQQVLQGAVGGFVLPPGDAVGAAGGQL